LQILQKSREWLLCVAFLCLITDGAKRVFKNSAFGTAKAIIRGSNRAVAAVNSGPSKLCGVIEKKGIENSMGDGAFSSFRQPTICSFWGDKKNGHPKSKRAGYFFRKDANLPRHRFQGVVGLEFGWRRPHASDKAVRHERHWFFIYFRFIAFENF
jgi:hypothetical protein